MFEFRSRTRDLNLWSRITVPERLTIDQKVILCFYWIVFGTTCILAFKLGPTAPPFSTFVFLVGIYAIPIVLIYLRTPLPIVKGLLLTSTALGVLIIIDPFEPELYGYDSFNLLNDWVFYLNYDITIETFVSLSEERPFFFQFSNIIYRLLDIVLVDLLHIYDRIDPLTVAKYIPLLSVFTPYLFYVALSKFTNARRALVVAFGFASVRTFLLIESQFINEMFGLFLFVLLLTLVPRIESRNVSVAVLGALGVALAGTHHFAASVATGFFGLWLGVSLLSTSSLPYRVPYLPRFLPNPTRRRAPIRNLAIATIAIGVVNLYFFSYIQTGMSIDLVNAFINRLLLDGSTGGATGNIGSGVGGEGNTVRTLLSSYGAILVLGLLAAINAATILTSYDNAVWETAWVVYNGILSVAYVLFLVIGRLVWLDPSRFLVFLLPFLLGVAIHALGEYRFHVTEWGASDIQIGSLIVILLVVTQTAAIPSYVLETDPSTSAIGESHNTVQHLSASDWLQTTGTKPVVSWEGVVWGVRNGHKIRSFEEFDGDCGDGLYIEWREAAARSLGRSREDVLSQYSVIYSSGDVSLGYCRGPS
ncbi:hypothetical protein KTS45_13420 [Halomicroarcula limicola]|uniref:DUF2206 domain-containing protein n=1 Tax=Haloarcula limicola TaxID=1429915 RepID=A0A8J8C5G9_9EURY|nr:hypothetical protein [Halomicroarcula limicola]MBV0925199.1 hypothetical protein [Halomicroarcula limicola]